MAGPAPTRYRYDVFLSNSSADKPVVRELAEQLRAAGLRVWFDEWLIQTGDLISAKIEEGLEHSAVLLLCMSANAFGSDWVSLEGHTAIFRDPQNLERRFVPLGPTTHRSRRYYADTPTSIGNPRRIGRRSWGGCCRHAERGSGRRTKRLLAFPRPAQGRNWHPRAPSSPTRHLASRQSHQDPQRQQIPPPPRSPRRPPQPRPDTPSRCSCCIPDQRR
jgi:hypothetical protein